MVSINCEQEEWAPRSVSSILRSAHRIQTHRYPAKTEPRLSLSPGDWVLHGTRRIPRQTACAAQGVGNGVGLLSGPQYSESGLQPSVADTPSRTRRPCPRSDIRTNSSTTLGERAAVSHAPSTCPKTVSELHLFDPWNLRLERKQISRFVVNIRSFAKNDGALGGDVPWAQVRSPLVHL